MKKGDAGRRERDAVDPEPPHEQVIQDGIGQNGGRRRPGHEGESLAREQDPREEHEVSHEKDFEAVAGQEPCHTDRGRGVELAALEQETDERQPECEGACGEGSRHQDHVAQTPAEGRQQILGAAQGRRRKPREGDLGQRQRGQELGVRDDDEREAEQRDGPRGKVGSEGVVDHEIDLAEVGADAHRQ